MQTSLVPADQTGRPPRRHRRVPSSAEERIAFEVELTVTERSGADEVPTTAGVARARVLEYHVPTAAKLHQRELPPHVPPSVAAVAAFTLSLASGGQQIPIMAAVLFGVGVGAAVFYIGHTGRRRSLSARWRVQLILALFLATGAWMAICTRAGFGDTSARGLSYWTNYNPGYAYNPRWALAPWPWLAIGIGWFLLIPLTAAAVRRRRQHSQSVSPCPSDHPSE